MSMTHYFIQGFFLTQLLFTSTQVALKIPKGENKAFLHKELSVTDVALGVWEYSMSNVKSPFTDGLLFITKEEGIFKVAVKFSNGVLSGEDVSVVRDRINFTMNISGLERVSFVLFVEGDRISGESYSANGSSTINGARKLPER